MFIQPKKKKKIISKKKKKMQKLIKNILFLFNFNKNYFM
jgi:hypothetical protein